MQEDEFVEHSATFDSQEFTQLLSSSEAIRIEHLGDVYYAINEGTYE